MSQMLLWKVTLKQLFNEKLQFKLYGDHSDIIKLVPNSAEGSSLWCWLNWFGKWVFYILLILITYFFFLESVNVTYIDRTGDKIKVRGKIGDNLLYLAHRYGIEVEGKLHVLQLS